MQYFPIPELQQVNYLGEFAENMSNSEVIS